MNPRRKMRDRISFGATTSCEVSQSRSEPRSVGRDETTLSAKTKAHALSAAHTMCANDRAVSRMTAKGVTRAYKAAEL
jgi:hypothetical protein